MAILLAALMACAVDVHQAESFLALMKVPAEERAVDDFLQLHGTELILAQQNVSRTVTAAEYREAMIAALRGKTPNLAQHDAPRAARGVEGLLNDVVPSIRWAAQHPELLRQRLDRFKTIDLCAARARAARYVPARSDAQANAFVVMGGRAGAAAIGNDIYFDVLATSYRAAHRNEAYPSDEEILDYFAHEWHHVLYGSALAAQRARLKKTTAAYDLLESLLLEGSATYFINLHRDLSRMKEIEHVDEVLKSLDDAIAKGDAAGGAFPGNAFHAAGAAMLAEIERAFGNATVRRVMLDPRLLLVTYNRAAAKRGARVRYRFRDETASAAAAIDAR